MISGSFSTSSANISVEQKIDHITKDGKLAGIEVEEGSGSTFMDVKQEIKELSGEMSGINIEQIENSNNDEGIAEN